MMVGILGLGSIGSRHAKNATALGHDVVGYDPIHQSTPRTQILSEADAIVIASPTEYHLRDVRDCLEHGKPCLVEKPLALPRQFNETLQLRTTSPVAVGFNLRFHPAIKAIKAQDPKPYFGSFMCGQFTDRASVITNGVLSDWACHEIDLALHLIGPQLRVIDKRIDSLSVDLRLTEWETGATAIVHSDIAAGEPFRDVLVAEQGRTFFVDLERDPVTNEHYQDELETFLRWAANPLKPPPAPLATAADGMRQLMIAARADK